MKAVLLVVYCCLKDIVCVKNPNNKKKFSIQKIRIIERHFENFPEVHRKVVIKRFQKKDNNAEVELFWCSPILHRDYREN